MLSIVFPHALGVDECSPCFESLSNAKRESTAINPRTRVFHTARESFAFDSSKAMLNLVDVGFQMTSMSVVKASARAFVFAFEVDST